MLQSRVALSLLSLVMLAGCKQEGPAAGTAGGEASGVQASGERAVAEVNKADSGPVTEAPLEPNQRVQGTLQVAIGGAEAAVFRSLATKIADDLGKRAAERMGSAAGQEDLKRANAQVGGGATVEAKDVQAMADAFAGRTVYTSEMNSLAIANLRVVELSGVAADGREASLVIRFALDSDTPTDARMELVPDGKKRTQTLVSDRKDKQATQVKLERFEMVDAQTLAIAGTFAVEKLSPGVLAKDLAGQEITKVSGRFDFTEVHIRAEK